MLKVAVQAIEIAIWVSVAILLWKTFFSVLFDTPFFQTIQWILGDLSYLLWSQYTMYVYLLLVGAILILICRWFISWLSTDWHTSPNN